MALRNLQYKYTALCDKQRCIPFDKQQYNNMSKAENQPPPGYPTEDPSTAQQKKKRFWQNSKPKGDRGFIEGCLFALCCCWMCEMCF